MRQTGIDKTEYIAGSGVRELYGCNDGLWKMKGRIDKGSDWSDDREDVVYVKLHFIVRSHYIVVGIC